MIRPYSPTETPPMKGDAQVIAHLNQVLPRARHNTGAQRLNDRVPVSGADDWGSSGGVHVG